ncbi:hypothetical protein tinsulaeT_20680 [Thalassotalea insulae]|uniref:Uncharacterized protein n=1 Tax=Thalassotalea insulae TaxID=2056778 RepID=A0ABQ6GRZ0_9GAMM|nr:hypothetical protein [Thalassotalea insulae]GLX78728.1 hypothetical protein tinsulaeT_20680 [Thalassotalea insulae]
MFRKILLVMCILWGGQVNADALVNYLNIENSTVIFSLAKPKTLSLEQTINIHDNSLDVTGVLNDQWLIVESINTEKDIISLMLDKQYKPFKDEIERLI